MNQKKQRPAIPWQLIVLFLFLFSGAILGGILNFKNQKRDVLNDRQQELSTIVDLKIRQVTEWRRERISDAVFLTQNGSIVQKFLEFIDEPENTRLKNDLLKDMKSLIDNYDYRNILFLDVSCNTRLCLPAEDNVIGDYLGPKLPGIIARGEIVISDLHNTGKVNFVHLDLLVPLKDPSDGSVFGILVLRIDPDRVLFPLLNTWPGISKSAEIMIFHREGDEIVYLSDLRYKDNSDLNFRLPVTNDKLVAAMAFEGISKTSDAVDYRDVPVVAAMNKIPETPWYLAAKIDREEIYEDLYPRGRVTVFMVLLIILTSGFFLGLLWWNQRVRFYRSKYEAEVERLALVRHYDYILKYANDIVFLFDNRYHIVEANDKAVETYLYSRDELIGMHVGTLRAAEARGSLENDMLMLNVLGNSTYETIHQRKDGSVFPIEISARKFKTEGVEYFQSISRDITERRIAEDTLRESEERFRKLFEESPIGMVMTAKDMGIVSANAAFCKMTGYSEEELSGMTYRYFTHPDNTGPDEVGLLLLVARKIPVYRTEKRYIRKDGSLIWGSTTIILIRNKEGEVKYYVGMVEDITSRKKAETELENSFSLLKATLESTADGILVVDNNGRIVQYNRKFAEMWRIPDEVMVTMEDETALNYVLDQLSEPDKFINKVRYVYSDPEAVISDLLEFRDGRCFDRYSQPQKIGGVSVGRVWSFRDITMRKKAELELIAAKEKAEESDRLKTAFLHNVSHEIRTPMNAILGFSTLLNDPDNTAEDRRQFTDVILQSGNQLLSIINDIVDLASIESGQMKLSVKQIKLNTTLRMLCEQFSYKGKTDKVKLELQTPLHLADDEILIDSTKLQQILSNLINNAFKFTEQGKIIFGYVLKERYLEFFVKDTGIGIASEHQSKIFDRFYQVDSAVSRQYGGTGLGLSICRAYIELMGGRIWLNSTPGRGTEFFFTVPLVKGETGN